MPAEIKQQEMQAAEFIDELSDEALDRPAGELAMACQQTAMTAMVKALRIRSRHVSRDMTRPA
jgi:hypothetical protein